MKKGIFITFEGVDGSGKSTHSRLVTEYLRKKGYNVVHTREPGGVSIAESLREILLHPKNRISPDTELFLYLAARAQHVTELIRPSLIGHASSAGRRRGDRSPKRRPALERGIGKPLIVISERFSDATFAYQGYGRKFNLKLLKKLDTLARQGVKPDLTLLFDLPIEQRKTDDRKGALDRLENEKLSFHKRVRRGYLELARQEPKRFRVVKIRGSIEKTQKEVRKIIDEFLTHTWPGKSN